MKKIAFNKDWFCYPSNDNRKHFPVTIPHDAMLRDERGESSLSRINSGWYIAKDYTYEKKFIVEDIYINQRVVLEFEGVYQKATVYLNEEKVAYHSYGYTGFYVDITDYLGSGIENVLKVEVINSNQPNSRWYTGTGIYRPVWLNIFPTDHIIPDSTRITTLDIYKPEIEVAFETVGQGSAVIDIMDGDKVLQSHTAFAAGAADHTFLLQDVVLWNDDTPKLYTCRIKYKEDEIMQTFGIRKVGWNETKGFTINDKRVILRGACIHHDNGLLGACAYDFAEERKIRILKENGYNAIRSSHNPCSKAMLRACDKLGMLVLDEYVDVWYIHKNKFDYASEVMDNYHDDLADIVNKDYNHPSVIMYSTGNEVSESGQKEGIKLCEDLTNLFHELDPTRPVTCGINIFFNFLSSIGFGVYSDKKADKELEQPSKRKAVGSEFFNNLSGLMGAKFMKFGATLYPCDVKTRDAFERMDISGYNYGINRYKKDLVKYKDRLILGSETFCSDAYTFWELAKIEPRLIGDFVWAGMDYLGEAGIGSWEYEDYAPDFTHGVGWVSAGSGRIDLTGKPLAEMRYTQVAFEQRDIAMGVVPVYQFGKKHSPSAWKMTNAIESWSWNSCDGTKTKVEVYARGHHVSLYLNDMELDTKIITQDCKVEFDVIYNSGELQAISYDSKNNIIAQTSLKTASEETILTLAPEQVKVKADSELCYVRLQYTDDNGTVKPMERGLINVEVEGGELIGLGSACPYYELSYLSNTTDTYYGEVLAIIKPTGNGNILIKAESDLGNAQKEIEVII
ncbi:MAG: glycoside hydrolase family 2 TIM barrel-domain containing protein [Suipraeoptans sp.]